MKKALVSGYIGFNNFGDEAIFYVLSSKLKAMDFKVSALCNNPLETKEKYDVETFAFKNPKEIIKAILKCDVLISGGGSLLQNKTSNFSLFYYLFILLIAKIFFKKTMIFAQGIEPIKGFFQELTTKLILKTVDFISVRDEKSKKYLEKLNVKSHLVSDPVYSILQETKISEEKNGLIVQLRSFKGMNEELINNLIDSIKTFDFKDIDIISFQDEIDLELCKKFNSKLKENNINSTVVSQTDIKETIGIINKRKYMISTRLHGAIVANALKTNIFTLNYDEKLKTLSEELDILNIDILNYSNEELKEKLKTFFNEDKKEFRYRRFNWEKIEEFLTNGK